MFAGVVLLHGAARAGEKLSVCIDSASNSAARDERIAAAVAKGEGVELAVEHFDRAHGDDGVSVKAGSLEHDDYVDIMAYLLQQNGYPAGTTALTFDGASQSKVPLRYHGK